MRKFVFVLLIGLCSLSSNAYNDLNSDTIRLDSLHYINNPQAVLKQKAVEIFQKDYTVFVYNVELSESWFKADVAVRYNGQGSWSVEDWSVSQSCDYEELNPDHKGKTSDCSTDLFQNYDFEIHSIVHLRKHDEYGDVHVTYTITDESNYSDRFNLVLVFPYIPSTITSIDDVAIDWQQPVEYYDLQGRKLNGPQPGIVIEKQGNKAIKKFFR